MQDHTQSHTKDKTSLIEAALGYAARGWAVFPLAPGTKVPLKGSKGFRDATTDSNTIRQWWTQTPDANVAIATGQVSGLLVPDVDQGNDKQGERTLRALEKQHGAIPETYTIKTPHGGRHLYLFLPAGVSIKSGTDKLGRWLDVKADGGYVVAPPSTFEGHRYQVLNATPPAPAPGWLVDLLSSQLGQRDRVTEGTKILKPSLSLCLSVQSIEDAVRLSLAESEHQNDRCLLTLARALISGFSMPQKLVAFDQWYEQTRIRSLLRQGQTRDDYLAKFLHAAKRAKYPLGRGPVDEAWKLACSQPFPPEAALFETEDAKRIVALCFQLDRLSKGQPWPLACRVLARLTGMAHTTAAVWLSALVSAGILSVVKINTERLATRYAYGKEAARQPAGN